MLSRKRSSLWLGYQDSNLEWLNQNQLCCQLHHTPLAAYHRRSQAISPYITRWGAPTAVVSGRRQLPKIRTRPTTRPQPRSLPSPPDRRRTQPGQLRSRPSSSSDSNSGGLYRAIPVAATRSGRMLSSLQRQTSNNADLALFDLRRRPLLDFFERCHRSLEHLRGSGRSYLAADFSSIAKSRVVEELQQIPTRRRAPRRGSAPAGPLRRTAGRRGRCRGQCRWRWPATVR